MIAWVYTGFSDDSSDFSEGMCKTSHLAAHTAGFTMLRGLDHPWPLSSNDDLRLTSRYLHVSVREFEQTLKELVAMIAKYSHARVLHPVQT